jgi:hypothetical protein
VRTKQRRLGASVHRHPTTPQELQIVRDHASSARSPKQNYEMDRRLTRVCLYIFAQFKAEVVSPLRHTQTSYTFTVSE